MVMTGTSSSCNVGEIFMWYPQLQSSQIDLVDCLLPTITRHCMTATLLKSSIFWLYIRLFDAKISVLMDNLSSNVIYMGVLVGRSLLLMATTWTFTSRMWNACTSSPQSVTPKRLKSSTQDHIIQCYTIQSSCWSLLPYSWTQSVWLAIVARCYTPTCCWQHSASNNTAR